MRNAHATPVCTVEHIDLFLVVKELVLEDSFKKELRRGRVKELRVCVHVWVFFACSVISQGVAS